MTKERKTAKKLPPSVQENSAVAQLYNTGQEQLASLRQGSAAELSLDEKIAKVNTALGFLEESYRQASRIGSKKEKYTCQVASSIGKVRAYSQLNELYQQAGDIEQLEKTKQLMSQALQQHLRFFRETYAPLMLREKRLTVKYLHELEMNTLAVEYYLSDQQEACAYDHLKKALHALISVLGQPAHQIPLLLQDKIPEYISDFGRLFYLCLNAPGNYSHDKLQEIASLFHHFFQKKCALFYGNHHACYYTPLANQPEDYLLIFYSYIATFFFDNFCAHFDFRAAHEWWCRAERGFQLALERYGMDNFSAFREKHPAVPIGYIQKTQSPEAKVFIQHLDYIEGRDYQFIDDAIKKRYIKFLQQKKAAMQQKSQRRKKTTRSVKLTHEVIAEANRLKLEDWLQLMKKNAPIVGNEMESLFRIMNGGINFHIRKPELAFEYSTYRLEVLLQTAEAFALLAQENDDQEDEVLETDSDHSRNAISHYSNSLQAMAEGYAWQIPEHHPFPLELCIRHQEALIRFFNLCRRTNDAAIAEAMRDEFSRQYEEQQKMLAEQAVAKTTTEAKKTRKAEKRLSSRDKSAPPSETSEAQTTTEEPESTSSSPMTPRSDTLEETIQDTAPHPSTLLFDEQDELHQKYQLANSLIMQRDTRHYTNANTLLARCLTLAADKPLWLCKIYSQYADAHCYWAVCCEVSGDYPGADHSYRQSLESIRHAHSQLIQVKWTPDNNAELNELRDNIEYMLSHLNSQLSAVLDNESAKKNKEMEKALEKAHEHEEYKRNYILRHGNNAWYRPKAPLGATQMTEEITLPSGKKIQRLLWRPTEEQMHDNSREFKKISVHLTTVSRLNTETTGALLELKNEIAVEPSQSYLAPTVVEQTTAESTHAYVQAQLSQVSSGETVTVRLQQNGPEKPSSKSKRRRRAKRAAGGEIKAVVPACVTSPSTPDQPSIERQETSQEQKPHQPT